MLTFKSKLFILGLIGFLLFPVTISAEEAAYQPKYRSGKAELVSVAKQSITLKDRQGAFLTALVLPDTVLRFRGGTAVLMDFKPGDKVQFSAQRDEQNQWVLRKLKNLSVRRKTVRGVLKNLSASSFEVETENQRRYTVLLSNVGKFLVDGQEKALLEANLRNDLRVSVKGRLRGATKTFIDVEFVMVLPEVEESE